MIDADFEEGPWVCIPREDHCDRWMWWLRGDDTSSLYVMLEYGGYTVISREDAREPDTDWSATPSRWAENVVAAMLPSLAVAGVALRIARSTGDYS